MGIEFFGIRQVFSAFDKLKIAKFISPRVGGLPRARRLCLTREGFARGSLPSDCDFVASPKLSSGLCKEKSYAVPAPF
jgi:hypothetical protein